MITPRRHDGADGTVTWYVPFRYGIGKNGRPKTTSETFGNHKDAEHFAKMLDLLGPAGALKQLAVDERDRAVPTVGQLAAEFIDLRANISDGTRLDYQRLWDRSWGDLIGDLPADQVNDDVLQRAVRQLARRYSRKSLENQRGLLSSVLARAVKKGYLLESPTRDLKLPRGAEHEQEDMTFLTPAEFDILLRKIPEHWQPLVMMLAGTGIRWGEAVALVGRDVRDGSVHITKAVKRDRTTSARVIGPPKTRRSRRTLVLPAQVVAALPQRGPSETLFVGPKGAVVAHQHFWENVWRPAVWRAQHCTEHTIDGCRCGSVRARQCPHHSEPPGPCGCAGTLDKTPRIHDLRHSHASWLIAAGVPLPVIQARLGHESITTTVDRYGHLMPDAQQKAAEAAQLVFAPLELEA